MKLRMHIITMGIATALALFCGVYFTTLDRGQPTLAALEPREGTFPAQEIPVPPKATASWPLPRAQSAGPSWIFDLFTPPLIYFDPLEQQFQLTPPGETTPPPPYPLQLVGIERRPYRLQYGGHAGEGAQVVLSIQSEECGRHWVGRVGDTFPEASFAILDFSVDISTTKDPEHPEATPYFQEKVTAVLYDFRERKDVILHRQLRFEDSWRALLRERRNPDQTHSLRIGDSVTLPQSKHTVTSIDPAAGTVSLISESPHGLPETHTLTHNSENSHANTTTRASEVPSIR